MGTRIYNPDDSAQFFEEGAINQPAPLLAEDEWLMALRWTESNQVGRVDYRRLNDEYRCTCGIENCEHITYCIENYK